MTKAWIIGLLMVAAAGCGDDDGPGTMDASMDRGPDGPRADRDADARPDRDADARGDADPCSSEGLMSRDYPDLYGCNGDMVGAGMPNEFNGPCRLGEGDGGVAGNCDTGENAFCFAGWAAPIDVNAPGYCTEFCQPTAQALYSTGGCRPGSICYIAVSGVLEGGCESDDDCPQNWICDVLDMDVGAVCFALSALCLPHCMSDGDCSAPARCDTSDNTCYTLYEEPENDGGMDGGDADADATSDADADAEPPPRIVVYGRDGIADGNLQLAGAAMSGREGADAVCRMMMPAGVPTMNVRAFLSVSDADEIRDFPTLYMVPTDRQIVTPNGTKIADDWTDLLDGNIDVSLAEAGQPYDFWSGSNDDGSVAPETCTGWTVNAMDASGGRGNPNATTNWLRRSTGPTLQCNNFDGVFCLAWE